MKLGCFGFSKDIDIIAEAGFDCIEMHYREIVEMDALQISETRKRLRAAGLTAEVFNNPLPLDKQIISEDFKLSDYKEHIIRGAEGAAELGARFCNFGNGKTRSLPVDGNIQEARKKVVECIKMICEINEQYNITVLIEPLSPVVSNFILSISEAINLCEELGCLNTSPFIDLRWHVDQGFAIDEIVTYKDRIAHIHIDNPLPKFPVRYIPKITDEYDYAPFIEMVKRICYKGIISCEANTFIDFKLDTKALIDFFKHFGIEPYRK